MCEASRSNTVQIRSRPSYLVRLSGHLDTTNQLLLNIDHCLPIRTNQLSLNTDHCLPIRKLGMGQKPPGKSHREKVLTNEIACKLVTNLLKPTACTHPINLCKSLGSGLSDLHHCVGCDRGPWLESAINSPFLPVVLSQRPSLFPLGDSDIRHNKMPYPSLQKRKYESPHILTQDIYLYILKYHWQPSFLASVL